MLLFIHAGERTVQLLDWVVKLSPTERISMYSLELSMEVLMLF